MFISTVRYVDYGNNELTTPICINTKYIKKVNSTDNGHAEIVMTDGDRLIVNVQYDDFVNGIAGGTATTLP